MMCGYFFIVFIDFMTIGKSILDSTDLFSPTQYEKNDKIIFKYSQYILKRKKVIKIYFIVCDNYRKFKKPKISYIFKKALGFSVVYSKCGNEYKKSNSFRKFYFTLKV